MLHRRLRRKVRIGGWHLRHRRLRRRLTTDGQLFRHLLHDRISDINQIAFRCIATVENFFHGLKTG